ncbi:tail length tape measure protein [Enterococcus phage vB_Efs19_KEN17]
MADKEMRIKVRVDNSDYTSKMKDMEGTQSRLGKSAEQSTGIFGKFFNKLTGGASLANSSMLGLGRSFLSTSVGFGTLTAAATPMAAAVMGAAEATKAAGRFAIDSIKDYSNFEGTLKQVQIIAGGTQADMDMLGDTAIEIGGKTSKGAQEVAEAMVDFAKLGFTAKETSEAMKGIVYAAEASGSGVQETAGIVATALNVWNLEASKAEHVADVLAKTANETAADMQDMGYVLQYAGSSASLAGASLEDLSAMAGIMADNGIKGSKAGTSLRTAFTNLINPTDGAAAAMESLGVQFKDAEGKARPTMDVIYDLQDAVKGMDDIQIQELSTILFGKPGAAGMSFVLKSTKEQVQDLSKALVDSTGTAAKQAAEMRETMAGQLDQLGDSVDAIKLKIGRAFTDMFALDAVKGFNKALDGVDEGLSNFGKGFKRTSDLLETSNGLISGTKDANKFVNAVRDAGTNLANIDFQESLAQSQVWGIGLTNRAYETNEVMYQLNKNIKEFDFLPDDWEGKWGQASTILKDSVGQMELKLASAAAKGKHGGEADISGIMNQTIQENLPALQSALDEQVAVFGTANQSRLDALQTFFANEKTITDEQKAQLMQGELVHGQQLSDTIQANNNKILELYQSMGQQDYAQRQETGAAITALQQQNSEILQNIAQVESGSIVETLRAQASSTGTITQQMANEAIAAANQQYTETVAAASKQYTESVNAINSMSDEEIAAAGFTKEQLIEKARQQMVGTVDHAKTQKEQTVGEIQKIADKSEEVDGTHIQINADADTSSAMEELGQLAARINDVFRAFGETAGKIQGGIDGFESKLRQADKWVAGKVGGIFKARGGLTSGVGYGIGGGNAQYSPMATAVGVGTQLGQGGINQGVIHNERGREVTMPIQNATYMRPFAAAVANELQAMGGGIGGGGVQEVIVPLYINDREFARATNKAMTEEQQRVKRIANRAVGKK